MHTLKALVLRIFFPPNTLSVRQRLQLHKESKDGINVELRVMRNLLFKLSLLQTREFAKEYQIILSVNLLTLFLTSLIICLALSVVTVSYR